jgi:leucyl-tRNA synthetase
MSEITDSIEFFKSIEQKWQKKWNDTNLHCADKNDKEKYFINFPFPYINGAPHLGHGYSLLKADTMARFQRMLGKNVLFPFAFHATGEPIVGTSKRVKNKDKSQINSLILSGIAESDIIKFSDPQYIVSYFKNVWTLTLKQLGLAIDWRRQFVTTTLTPVFSKFVEWQYRTLKREGYVVQGSHPVIWCPADKNPTGDHDRLKGEGARVVDFILLKFKSESFDAYFLPATLRPETIFGVTNIFLHPEAEYVKVKINDEWYIIAKANLIKFTDQQFTIGEMIDLKIEELIGSFCINPITNEKILLLPGNFVDYEGTTGVVMSVPAHAPMDWIALKNIKEDLTITKKWKLKKSDLESINPISLISVEGYGEFPAGEAIDEFNVKSMDDPNVKEATKLIYRKEHNNGVLKAITGQYKGKSVQEVKDILIKDLQDKKIAFVLQEPGEVVVCRCGTRNHVKFLENQWFLAFSDKAWKEKTHKLLDQMNMFPEDARLAFHNTIDWLENKACARRSGLGTPLPWDTEWIVETLSDSVIYMAYYILSKYVNAETFKLENACDEVFDYIFLDKGTITTAVEKSGVSKQLLTEIKTEFDYFYGFDLRTSGKDLINNHLSFMLMHHTAIFPEKYWPKGLATNGYVAIVKPGEKKGEKMSKSKGNFKTIIDVIAAYGVDATRIIFLNAGEGLKDAQVTIEDGENYSKWLLSLYSMAFEKADDEIEQNIDKWLKSRIIRYIKKVTAHLHSMETRSAFYYAYHQIQQDLKWYLKRRGSKGPSYVFAIESSIRMLTPFAPHLVEEIWEKWNKVGFASEALFPLANDSLIDENAENNEKYISALIDDLKGLKVLMLDKKGLTAQSVEIFVSSKWKFDIYAEAYLNGTKDLIKRVMQTPDIKKFGKEASKYAQNLLKGENKPQFAWSYSQEWDCLQEAKKYIEEEIGNILLQIHDSEKSSDPKANIAIPGRPGIHFNINV